MPIVDGEHGRGRDREKKFNAFNAGVMLLHLDELKKVRAIARLANQSNPDPDPDPDPDPNP